VKHLRTLLVFGIVVTCAASGWAQGPDPRTAAGQLAVCGGAASWQSIGYLEFQVSMKTPGGAQGPWLYQWGRRDGLLRLQGPGPAGQRLDVVLDIASRTGGAWANGAQLAGSRLAEATNWALQRFGEDVLWLTFPLEWGAARVEVKSLPNAVDGATTYQAVEVKSPGSTWTAWLDPASGRVYRTVVTRAGAPKLTVVWSEWRPVAGVYFAHVRTIGETNETVEVDVKRALPQSPPDVF
jgi:hypothetical protein